MNGKIKIRNREDVMRKLATLIVAMVLAAAGMIAAVTGEARATAKFATTPPTIDGIVSPGEWDFADTEFDTGARPSSGSGWDNSGAKAKFAYDNTNVYGLIQAYPNPGTCGSTNENGVFDNLNWEVYINGLGWPAAIFLDTTGGNPNNVPGSTAAFGTVDPNCPSGPARFVIEFAVPIASIVDTTGGNLPNPYTFDPTTDFLEYRVRTTDPDTAGGFDSRDQTLGWVIEPPETGGGYRRLDFEEAPAPSLDHFKCYRVKNKKHFHPRWASLVDRFQSQNALVLQPVSLCTPVDKNGEGISNPDALLMCFNIIPRKPVNRTLEVENQFGKQRVKVLRPQTLCVPSAKTVR